MVRRSQAQSAHQFWCSMLGAWRLRGYILTTPASQQPRAAEWPVGISLAAVAGHSVVIVMAVDKGVLHTQPSIPKVSSPGFLRCPSYQPVIHIHRCSPSFAVTPGPPPKPNPTELNLPVLMFGPWTFPHSKNGCQYSFDTDKTTDQWPFGLCTLYDVPDPEEVDFVDPGEMLLQLIRLHHLS